MEASTSRPWQRHTGRVAGEQRLDEVARLLADNQDVGRVIGARPSEGTSCDIELVMLSRVDGGYRLRSAVVDLDRLREVRGDLHGRSPPFPTEDLTFPTFLEAMRSDIGVHRGLDMRDLGWWRAG